MTETINQRSNEATSSAPPKTQQYLNAKTIVKKYMVVAGGIGIIPVPLFDQISIGALQAKMIYDLGQLYKVNIVEYRVKAIIAAILGGAHSQWITRYLVGYLTMLIPGINVVGTLVTRPALAGTITYVIGDIFIKQFEKGATLENFDVEKAKQDFAEQFKSEEPVVKPPIQTSIDPESPVAT